MAQTNDKFIYVANNHTLLEFDGVRWKSYPSPNGSIFRAVSVAGDVIYTGCYMDFGFWTKDGLGRLSYTSLLGIIDQPVLEDEEFWNVQVVDDSVLFQSLSRIYVYNILDKSIGIIEAETAKAKIFNLRDHGILFQIKDKGIYKITKNRPELVTDDPSIKSRTVVGIFENNDGLVYLTTDGQGFFSKGGSEIRPWQFNLDSGSADLSIYSFLQLKDQSVILGTISHGMYQMTKEGQLLQHINQQNGLNNNTILNIFEDKDSNLWLAHDIGLSILNLSSPFQEYNDTAGNLGVVYTSTVYNGDLYLGTNQGLFRSRSSTNNFDLVPGTEGQVWCLVKLKNKLFCGHNNGTYLVEGNRAELISNVPGTWNIKEIEGVPDRLLQGNYNGLSVLKYQQGQWGLGYKIEGFNVSSRFFEFSDPDHVVVNHEYKGLFHLELNSGKTKVVSNTPELGKGYATSLVRFNDQLLYATNNGVFSFANQDQEFVLDSTLTKVFEAEGEGPMSILIPDDSNNRLWRFADHDMLYIEPSNIGNTPRLSKIAIPSFFRSNLGVSGFENINALGNGNYLIGTSGGYVTLDLEKVVAHDYPIYLTGVTKEYHNKPSQSVPHDSIMEFRFEDNSLGFAYSVPEYDKYTEVRYQYQLVGLYDSWSNWSSQPEISFENLPFGDYIFKVRAKVGGSLTENTASYAFIIRRPWYLSIPALVMYGLVFLVMSFSIHRVYKRYYRKQRERIVKENKRKLKRKKIQNQKRIVQINNERLLQEIEAKNRELAVSTMSLIKKNEFLNAIKDQLKKANNESAIKSVIRTIDRNISNEDDWKFFEEAFNNADKHFLKKIKEQHPELTANDLRLCAYLRLNLSSKEIAPLLNISLRSVEVKRYRLRKKMKLPHEEGLIEYILSI
ncbi:triple tyrosine motif-containing protein [Flagellimonas aequoris]|uniref:triple tyrosine motif-containing protein n=1 Tax=Flagellimonas aequoris TaxID=2306997 RepID=UPI001F36E67F|nr:triple tyrosine motif-containing protein [Allomuricauda aequoris]